MSREKESGSDFFVSREDGAQDLWHLFRMNPLWRQERSCCPDKIGRRVFLDLELFVSRTIAILNLIAHGSTGDRPFLEGRVVVRIGWRATTEKSERLTRKNSVPCPGWDKNCVARTDFALFTIEVNNSGAFEQEVEFFRQFVKMAFGRRTGGKSRLCEALIFHWRVCSIENTSNPGMVLCRKWHLIFEVLNNHSRQKNRSRVAKSRP